ncbi:hypothetical protein Salat_1644800 [Sesamum alatum]|uniref:Uncharacterized protein n=1 Tax=Sesamum alatum TaxID=300844 RepID=A0AAE1Y6Z1_9LAMI|nr:hypothetical protein Salat_1644800 [Sesamum alatum]
MDKKKSSTVGRIRELDHSSHRTQYSPHGRASTWSRDLGPGRPTQARRAPLCLELGGLGAPEPGRTQVHQLEAVSSWGGPRWTTRASSSAAHQLKGLEMGWTTADHGSARGSPRALACGPPSSRHLPRAGLYPRLEALPRAPARGSRQVPRAGVVRRLYLKHQLADRPA